MGEGSALKSSNVSRKDEKDGSGRASPPLSPRSHDLSSSRSSSEKELLRGSPKQHQQHHSSAKDKDKDKKHGSSLKDALASQDQTEIARSVPLASYNFIFPYSFIHALPPIARTQ